MLIDVKGGAVTISCPAKLNLFLEVLGKRADGYHEIETLMCPISLCDTLEIRPIQEPNINLQVELPIDDPSVDNDPAWDIPCGERNLVYRAVQRVRERLNVQTGCQIQLKKAIPAAAGLGGGSSDAAAAIVAAMVAWGNWDRLIAAEICASLGSDLNLFLGDKNGIGLALAKGRGENCEILACKPALEFVVTHPPAGCATSAVYANWRKSGSPRSSADLIRVCHSGALQQIGPLFFNALQESAKCITPWIEKQLDFLHSLQFRYSAMSGSGSSCFALITETYTMADMRRAANVAGLSRVYAVKSWTQPSIEEQLQLVGAV